MAKYILSGDARDIPLAASMLLAMEQMFEQYKGDSSGGGSSSKELAPKRQGKIRIFINFLEPLAEVDSEFNPVPGQISFRLMNDDPKTITLARLQGIATKIKEKFNGFTWRKGKVMCSYTDWDKGYQFQILAIDGAEGKRVVDQALEIQSHTFEAEYFNVNTNWAPATRYPVLPDKTLVAGESVREDRQRPIANVRLVGAEARFPRIRRGVTILDSSLQIIQELKLVGKAS